MAKILLATPSRQQLPFARPRHGFVQRFRLVFLEIPKHKLVKLVRKEAIQLLNRENTLF